MAKAIKQWLENFSSQNVQIWCEDPETNVEKYTVGYGSKTYLTYRILLKQVGRDIVGVRHRYSEFETLRNQLKDRYAPLGICVPSLPPKNSIKFVMMNNNKTDASLVKERTSGLTMFCEAIVASPWLSNDKQWKAFMKPSTGRTIEDDTTNVGETQLIATLLQLEIPHKYTLVQRMEDVKEEVMHIEKCVKVLLDKAKAVQAAERAMQTANESLVAAMDNWTTVEKSNVRSLTGHAFDENESLLDESVMTISTLQHSATLLRSKCVAQKDLPEYTGLTLVVALENELALMESMKELFKMHEEILQSIDSLSSKLNKTESGKAANKLELAADLRHQLEEKQSCLTAFYKGVIYFTLPSVSRVRATVLRRLCTGLACVKLTSAHTLQQACFTYFSALRIAPTAAIIDICRTFELLSIKQLDNIPIDPEQERDCGSPSSGCSGMVSAGLLERAQAIGAGQLASTAYSPKSGGLKPLERVQRIGESAPVPPAPATAGSSKPAAAVIPPPATSSVVDAGEVSPTDGQQPRAVTPPPVSEKAQILLDGLMNGGNDNHAASRPGAVSGANIKARAADSGIWGDDENAGDV